MIEPDAKILVTEHAIERARERLGWEGWDQPLRARIRLDVRGALLTDRIAAVRPNWSRGAHADDLPDTSEAQRYAWDNDVSRCWVLEVRADGTVRVRTVFASSDSVAELAEHRGVRKGMKRT